MRFGPPQSQCPNQKKGGKSVWMLTERLDSFDFHDLDEDDSTFVT